jgi:hypothetical protein
MDAGKLQAPRTREDMVTPAYDLPVAWRRRAEELRRFGAEPQALALDVAAEELERALSTTANEAIPLSLAAEESGYSTSQLRRMVRQGKLRNVGSNGEVRVLRSALPRKPGSPAKTFAGPGGEPLSWRTQVARAVASGE